MKNVILHVLCEGQTEERFVHEVLSPYLQRWNIFPKAIVLTTSRKKGTTGGVTKYCKIQTDLTILLNRFKNKGADVHLITTMLDYYAIPTDFPGYSKLGQFQNPYDKVRYLEESLARHFGGNHRLIPYLQLHEFEALLFTDIMVLERDYPKSTRSLNCLKIETDRIGNPELINSRPDTAPSKRIISALEDNYSYAKVKSGAAGARAIGIERMLDACLHFRNWIECIIEKGTSED